MHERLKDHLAALPDAAAHLLRLDSCATPSSSAWLRLRALCLHCSAVAILVELPLAPALVLLEVAHASPQVADAPILGRLT